MRSSRNLSGNCRHNCGISHKGQSRTAFAQAKASASEEYVQHRNYIPTTPNRYPFVEWRTLHLFVCNSVVIDAAPTDKIRILAAALSTSFTCTKADEALLLTFSCCS